VKLPGRTARKGTCRITEASRSGIVGKRRDSIYEPEKRSGAWNYREPIQL
jgi:hypothetical protein